MIVNPQPPVRPRRHRLRWAFGILGGILAIIIGISLAASSSGNKPQTGSTGLINPATKTTAPLPTYAPSSPAIKPANRVAFVISGNVPASQFGEVDITYGSDSNTHDVTLPSLAGKTRYVVPFDPSAQYYSVDVTFSSSGTISCKIVVLGPAPDAPLVVSHGNATGGNNGSDCSAQAAPNDSTGESWQNEQ